MTRFDLAARRVVVLAQEEARLLHHNYIGTEHLLLGLLAEADGVAARALADLGVTRDGVRADVERIIGCGQVAPSGHIPFTPRAKRVLELSLRESRNLGHNYIGTEHVLFGLLAEGGGVGAQVLTEGGVSLVSSATQCSPGSTASSASGRPPSRRPGRSPGGPGARPSSPA